jgi:hypothetical protein
MRVSALKALEFLVGKKIEDIVETCPVLVIVDKKVDVEIIEKFQETSLDIRFAFDLKTKIGCTDVARRYCVFVSQHFFPP